MINDYQPALVCIVETLVQKQEEIQIPGYSFLYHNDRSANRLATYVGHEKELSKRRRGHKMPQMQSKQEKYTTEHVLECQTAETVYKIRDNTPLINRRQTY